MSRAKPAAASHLDMDLERVVHSTLGRFRIDSYDCQGYSLGDGIVRCPGVMLAAALTVQRQ